MGERAEGRASKGRDLVRSTGTHCPPWHAHERTEHVRGRCGEHAHAKGQDVTGAAADIHKCFDQIVRPLLYHLALIAGIPRRILFAYATFMELVLVQNSVAGGLGKLYRRKCGIPQGCPLSMVIIAAVMVDTNAIIIAC